MTAIKLKSIENLMLEKHISDNCDCEDGEGCRHFAQSVEEIEHDRVITEQGNREITMDREKLADNIQYYKVCDVPPVRIDRADALEIADTIIKSQSQIIKAVV